MELQKDGEYKFRGLKQFNYARSEDDSVVYNTELKIEKAGEFKFGVRLYPKNEMLPHRQDFALVKWIHQ